MQNYTTQMDAARKGIVTPEMEIVAKKEYRTTEEIRQPMPSGFRQVWCLLAGMATLPSATS